MSQIKKRLGQFINTLFPKWSETLVLLETCKETGIEPKKLVNVRIGEEFHEKAVKRAGEIGKSLNDYIKDIVRKDTESHV